MSGEYDFDFEPDLADVARAGRAELRDVQELAEDASEQLARKEADLVDLILDAMHRGQRLRARLGSWQFDGAVTHVADDLAVLDDGAGARVDVRLSALSELWLHPPVRGAGRGRRASTPASFEDCLEGLETTGGEVELGGPDLPPSPCRVLVAARDHVLLQGRSGQRVVPRGAIGFIVRR